MLSASWLQSDESLLNEKPKCNNCTQQCYNKLHKTPLCKTEAAAAPREYKRSAVKCSRGLLGFSDRKILLKGRQTH